MSKVKTVFQLATFFIVANILVGCFEKSTTDPVKTYQYWAGEKPGKEVQVLNGRYWESAHWTKEYIMYLCPFGQLRNKYF